MSAYPSAFTNWVSDLKRDELIEILWNRMSEEDKQEMEAESNQSVDDYDHPNIYPYKKCCNCEERKSCGKYDDNKDWYCEDCSEEEKEEEIKVYPCPKCEYCSADKTWETTKYIKGSTFLNKDACLDCYAKSDDGYEKGYFE